MEEPDEAMVQIPTDGMPIAVYSPLQPLTEHELRLTQETTTRRTVIRGSETRCQVKTWPSMQLPRIRNAEQIGQVQLQQDRLAEQTSAYLRTQSDRQSALIKQQQEMLRQMDEHRHYLEEQYKVLRAAEQPVGLQGQRLESLPEAVQPHLQAGWGAFAKGEAQPRTEQSPEATTVTVAAGPNLPDKRFALNGFELQDAESRLSRLMAHFYEIIDRLNMEDVVHTEPKKVVGYLVDALRPQP
ncbi:Hypothetical protein PHPALM_12650 [Phytophthora palmivora]|uniref:Uncharacterized protein n=1 Tax=Phytophthora palmivora TaxID=4796 RepID=A0A2P4XZ89_9STRA|nr:Hypothetical protein PHPALM_12650 [Phytophthora palmivora]